MLYYNGMEEIIKPLAWNIGGLVITPFGLSFALALVFYLFFVWRQFAKEYDEQVIVQFSLVTSLGFIFGGRVFYGFFHFTDWGFNLLNWLGFWYRGGFSFLGGALILFLTTVIFCQKKGWSSWQFVEGITRPVLLGATVIALGAFFTTGKSFGLMSCLGFAFVLGVSLLLAGYRSFTWYPSGRVGFLFLASLILICLFQGGLDFYQAGRLYFSSIGYWAVCLVSGVVLYFLSKK